MEPHASAVAPQDEVTYKPPHPEVISRSRETTGCETNTNKDIITPKRKHWNKLTSGTDIPVRKDEDSLPSTVTSRDSDLLSPPFDSPSPEKEDGASAAKVLLPLLGEPSPAKQPTKKMRGEEISKPTFFSPGDHSSSLRARASEEDKPTQDISRELLLVQLQHVRKHYPEQ